ncbi:MAG: hypothetical protein VX278_17610 [Myxococcota bacterium]|nr:hypothetical protein [Myxococcota bacterium]
MSIKGLKKNRFSLSGNQLLQNIKDPTFLESEEAPQPPVADAKPARHTMRSGHEVEILLDEDQLMVYSPEGKLSVKIALEEQGPSVEVEGAKLKLKSPQDIDMTCENFSVHANKDLYMNANGGLIIESTQELQLNCEVDVHIRAKVIWLN